MSRISSESGFTLVELLVGAALSLIIFSASLALLETHQRQGNINQTRLEAQDVVRSAIDRMSVELRNAASACGTQPGVSCTGSAAGALQRSTAYDVIFQTVEANQTFGSGNPTNQEWVRYCLDASNPASETLWKEVLSWTTSPPPAMPTTTACPGTGTGSWPTSGARQLLSNITNQINGQNRPLFSPYIPTGATAPSVLGVDVFLNLTPTQVNPSETELRDGINLRNSLSTPTSSFTISQVNGNVQLDGSTASDPNGQALSYQWYQSTGTTSACPPTGTGVTQPASTVNYSAGPLSGTYSFALVVTDTAGLQNCSTQTRSF